MQLRPCSGRGAARRASHALVRLAAIAWLAALLACPLGAAPARAQESGAADEGPSERAPIDPSKHGTVEAEIPATRESTTGPPDRELLRSRLLEPRWDRGGFFIGLGGHYAIELTEQIGGIDTLASGGGLSMRVGLKHNRFWQTEFFGMYTSRFRADGDNFFAWGLHLGERFYLSKRRLQPYVGAHVGFLAYYGSNYIGSTYAFVPKFNAGFNFYQHETLNWELDLSYFLGEIGAGDDGSFVTATIGFTWF